jgi:hypothetical protein
MSARSELVFRATGMISNPLLLCALVSGRVRQLMIGGSGSRSTAEIVDYALGELLAGLLQFQMPAENDRKSKVRPPSSHLMAAARVVLEVQAT